MGIIFGVFFGMIQALLQLTLRIVFKILSFTGLWITIIMVVGAEWLVAQYYPEMKHENPSLYWAYQYIYGVITLIPSICITIKNTIKLVKG